MDFKYNKSSDCKSIINHAQNIIETEIIATDLNFSESFSFAGPSEYLSPIQFKNCKIKDLDTYVNHFKSTFEFYKCELNNVYLSGQFYEEVIFQECIINGYFKIVDSVFHKKVIFHKNHFLKGCNLFEKHLYYGSVEFKNGIGFY